MIVCQAMADRSKMVITILETGKMGYTMVKERKSVLMAQPMWVPGKTT